MTAAHTEPAATPLLISCNNGSAKSKRAGKRALIAPQGDKRLRLGNRKRRGVLRSSPTIRPNHARNACSDFAFAHRILDVQGESELIGRSADLGYLFVDPSAMHGRSTACAAQVLIRKN